MKPHQRGSFYASVIERALWVLLGVVWGVLIARWTGLRGPSSLVPPAPPRIAQSPIILSSTLGSSIPQLQQQLVVVTPTYEHASRIPNLVRLSATLSLVPNLLWILVEDGREASPAVQDLLARTSLRWVYLHAKQAAKNKGFVQRNEALKYIREHNDTCSGAVYFADDDNTYDLRVFEEARSVRPGFINVWPVGFLTARDDLNSVERPQVRDGKIVGFLTDSGRRAYPLDMAAFSVHALHLRAEPDVWFGTGHEIGFVQSRTESRFLEQLLGPPETADLSAEDVPAPALSLPGVDPRAGGLSRLVPMARECTAVYVWHTRGQAPPGRLYPTSWIV